MNLWEAYGEVYDTIKTSPAYIRMLNEICKELDLKGGETVLDAGCGTGNLCQLLAQKTPADIVGIDFSDTMLQAAKEKLKGTRVKLIKMDLNAPLRFMNRSFESIVIIHALYAVKNPADLLAEFYRILKPGGKLIIVNPTPTSRPPSTGTLKINPRLSRMFSINSILYQKGRAKEYHFLSHRQLNDLLTGLNYKNITTRLTYRGNSLLVIAKK